jgi:Fur family transcriptional regulator, peroxide stress response regulator
MDLAYTDLLNELKRKNIRLSHHRLKVLEYLCQNLNHPTVEQIYVDLQKEVTTLSKTTIYNSLNVLIESWFSQGNKHR